MKICVDITNEMLSAVDALVSKGLYGSRTDIVRDGIRKILKDEQPQEPFIKEILRRMDERRKEDERLYSNLTYDERMKLHKA